MCLSRAWFAEDSEAEPIMAEVACLSAADGKLVLTSLFGEQKEIAATIQEVDFLKSTITLVRS